MTYEKRLKFIESGKILACVKCDKIFYAQMTPEERQLIECVSAEDAHYLVYFANYTLMWKRRHGIVLILRDLNVDSQEETIFDIFTSEHNGKKLHWFERMMKWFSGMTCEQKLKSRESVKLLICTKCNKTFYAQTTPEERQLIECVSSDDVHHLVYFVNYTLMSRGRQGIVLLLHYFDEVSQKEAIFDFFNNEDIGGIYGNQKNITQGN
jgi:ribosomal protein L37AE/L43A